MLFHVDIRIDRTKHSILNIPTTYLYKLFDCRTPARTVFLHGACIQLLELYLFFEINLLFLVSVPLYYYYIYIYIYTYVITSFVVSSLIVIHTYVHTHYTIYTRIQLQCTYRWQIGIGTLNDVCGASKQRYYCWQCQIRPSDISGCRGPEFREMVQRICTRVYRFIK